MIATLNANGCSLILSSALVVIPSLSPSSRHEDVLALISEITLTQAPRYFDETDDELIRRGHPVDRLFEGVPGEVPPRAVAFLDDFDRFDKTLYHGRRSSYQSTVGRTVE